MDQNQETSPYNRNRQQTNEENPYMLNTPVNQYPTFDTPPNQSFTQLLQQPTIYPTTNIPQANLFQPNPQHMMHYPNQFAYSPNMFQYPQPTPQTPHSQPSEETIPESVPETQPDVEVVATSSKRKHKKGKGKKTSSQSGRILWTEEEEVALTRAWIAISEDNLRGNAQSGEAFWDRVLAYFHHRMGKGNYRTSDMLTSKWRDLLRYCNAFNGIYVNCLRQWESGKKDFDVLIAAISQYKKTHNVNGFAHTEAWKVMRDGPKWVLQPDVLTSSGSNKRSRTSVSNDYTHYSDARTAPIDLNEDVDESEQSRPEGRDKARDKAKSKGKRPASSRQSVSNREEDMDYFKDVFSEHLSMSKKKIEMKKETREQQQIETDLRMLSMQTQGLPDENREVIEKVQKTIRDRLKNIFKF